MNHLHDSSKHLDHGDEHHVDAVINLLIAIFIIAFLTLVLVSPTG